MKKFLKWALSALYGLVMIEVIIMISPFAIYWYTLYAPTLQGLHRWRATAWLEAFFLPHSVITTSRLLEIMRWQIGTYAFSLGVLAAIFCGLQAYFTRLIRHQAAQSWLYTRIRHPFYLSLEVAGFGLLTMWPRVIILILYLGVLFFYYFLSRFEERQMEAKFPEYAEYRRRTWMFLPGDPGGKLFRVFFGRIANRRVALGLSSLAITVLVIGGALLLRHYTIGRSATELLSEERTLAIAIWPMPPDKIRQVASVAFADNRVRSALEKEQGAAFTAHILPDDYGMMNMFADVGSDHRMFNRLAPRRFKYLLSFVFPFFDPGRKYKIMGSPQDKYKVVFSRVDEPGDSNLSVSKVTDLSAKMTPVAIAEIHGPNPVIKEVTIPPHRSFWGDITMPMF